MTKISQVSANEEQMVLSIVQKAMQHLLVFAQTQTFHQTVQMETKRVGHPSSIQSRLELVQQCYLQCWTRALILIHCVGWSLQKTASWRVVKVVSLIFLIFSFIFRSLPAQSAELLCELEWHEVRMIGYDLQLLKSGAIIFLTAWGSDMQVLWTQRSVLIKFISSQWHIMEGWHLFYASAWNYGNLGFEVFLGLHNHMFPKFAFQSVGQILGWNLCGFRWV